jgi:hypothetical protein
MLQTFVLHNFNQKQTVKHDHKFTIIENNNIKISKHKIKNHPKLSFYFNNWLGVKKFMSHMYMQQLCQGMAGNMVDIPSTHKLVFFNFTSVFLLLFLKGKNYVLLQW